MDSFIRIIEQKKEELVTTLHTKQIELLKKYLTERKNVFICGASGVGKSYLLKCVLNERNSLEIEKDHLKSKSPFLSFIQTAPKHAFI
jgi:putative ribosome biogenesis GTPase RsgA